MTQSVHRLIRYINIKTNFEAFHRWKDAPEEVKFLRDYHRHIFKVQCAIAVKHNERELEFFMVKSKLDKFIRDNWWGLYFDDSCETIAEEIIGYIRKEYGERPISVEVTEDGENGAILHSEPYGSN